MFGSSGVRVHSRDCQIQKGPLAHDVFANDAIACMVLSWEGLGRSGARAAISNLALRGVQRGCRTLCLWWLLGAASFHKLRGAYLYCAHVHGKACTEARSIMVCLSASGCPKRLQRLMLVGSVNPRVHQSLVQVAGGYIFGVAGSEQWG